MKKIYILTLVIIAVITSNSCSNRLNSRKNQYINDFEKFITVVEQQYMSYDNEAWKKSETEFEKFTKTEFEKINTVLTEDEKVKIDKLKGRYYSCVAKYKALQLKEKLKHIYNQAEGFIDGIMKEL